MNETKILAFKTFANPVIKAFKFMLLSLEFVNEKDGTAIYKNCLQDLKNDLANGQQ